MTTTQRLGIDIVAFNKTAQAFASVEKGIGGITRSMQALKTFAAGAFGALSLGTLGAVLKSTIDHMDELGKVSQKVGIPVAELSKLEYAAKLSDVSIDQLNTTFARFSKSLAEVGGGSKNDAGSALRALGISATTVQGQLRPTTDIIMNVADSFASMRDGAGKTALAISLFGKSGAEMIPLLNGGSSAIKSAGDQLERFGGVVTPEASRQAEHFNDNLTKLHAASDGLRNQMATALLPSLTSITDIMVTFAENGDLAKKAAIFLNDAMKTVAVTAATTYKEFYAVSRIVGVLAENFSNPTNDLEATAQRWKDAFADIKTQADETAASIAKMMNIQDFTGSNASIDKLVDIYNGKGGLPDNLNPKTFQLIKPVTAGGGGGGGAGASAVQPIPADTIESIYGASKSFQELWDSMSQTTAIGNEFMTMQQQLAVGLQDSLGGALDSVISQFSDVFAGVVSGTMDVKDAFAEMARGVSQTLEQLAAELLKSSIITLLKYLPGLLAGGGGAGINVGGMTFGGLYADGGNLGAGKWGIAGEAGPEIIHGPARITPMDKMGGGGSSMNVQINNYAGADVKTKQGNDGQLQIDIVRKVVADDLARGGGVIAQGIERGYGLRRAGR